MLSIQELINNAYKREEKFITVKIERMNGEIKLKIPSSQELYEIKEKYRDYSEMASNIVYSSCVDPKLNEERLIQHFDCKVTPHEVVDKIFGFDTKLAIAEIIFDKIEEETKEGKVEIIKN